MEGIVGTKNLRYKHIGLFSDNTASVSWTQRGASKKSAAAGCLLRVLDLRQRVARVSPLVAAHMSVYLNMIGDIISCSFGHTIQWHCTNDSEFLSLMKYQLPLPHQRPWQGFHLYFTLSTKVISELGTKEYPMGEWKKLRRIGESIGGSGVPIENPSELTHTWRK